MSASRKSLFQPKWRTGGLFGANRMSLLAGRMGFAGANYPHRPYGYQYNYNQMANPFNEIRFPSNQMGGYSYPMNTELTIAQSPLNYNNNNYNDGWSLQESPYPNPAKIQQSQINIYDSQPTKLTAANLTPILDSYANSVGSTKGGSSSNKLTTTTKK